MLRDLRIFRRGSNAGKNNENLPADSSACAAESDPSRPPLHAIQDPAQNPNQGTFLRRKPEAAATTPSRNQGKGSDSSHLLFRTPENRRKFGWAAKSEQGGNDGDNGEDCSHQGAFGQLPPLSRGGSLSLGAGYGTSTPRTYRTGGKALSAHSDSSSTQSTPTKSVSKPSYSGFSSSSRPAVGLGSRAANFSIASRGNPVAAATPTVYNVAEVPHFELKEDPSFWMDNNVQVVIRIRPLNGTERNLQGFHRCLKQESAQSITWIGHPETRFVFDYVACEAVNQETLFRVAGLPMVENCMSGYNSCVFAYGQTGSGKTYTMLGEIGELETRSSLDRGMTPRIFEFLFARIRAEEESRRDEKLRYNCKCSFLEIYNEQITDLLDPSSSNLLLREDIRNGVYVENLTEYVVENVGDILKLLILGASNRKVAATNMNRESSRSHSVFTCVIESRWEKDSSTNLRFARLNLVDLAGSERQKTSGAEGERLKEAANINKSLSTLGHVIMLLADVANGKQRHVPYRDSRLTFLLQDSLGGNSKTMIIANVSPSICSANETLSTLRFAQRARLIQNNAIINEDSFGDVIALQHQIRLLKEELSLLKRQNVSRSLSFRTTIFEDSGLESDVSMTENSLEATEGSADTLPDGEASCNVRVSVKQLKSLEAILAGALRREKMADNTIKQLEAEIEQLNRLVRQREEETRSIKMMLKFREDKIQRMEKLVNSQLPADSFLIEEKNAFSEEVQLLRGRLDRNPEVTRFALENIRLLDQIRRFQDFYEEGERELLLTEISDLRNKLLEAIAGKSEINQTQDNSQTSCLAGENESLAVELQKTSQELENCRKELKSCLDINERLTREVSSLHNELNSIRSTNHGNVECGNTEVFSGSFQTDAEISQQGESLQEDKIKHAEEILNLQLELDILKTILAEEKSCRIVTEERSMCANNDLKNADARVLYLTKQNEDMNNELMEARSVIEALETEHIQFIEAIEELKKKNNEYVDLLKQEQENSILKYQHGAERPPFAQELKDQPCKHYENEDSYLQMKLKRMQASFDKARDLNSRFQCGQFSQSSIEQEMDEVRRQVEVETAEVIVCLQEELAAFQKRADDSSRSESIAKQHVMELKTELKQLQEMLSLTTQENTRLGELVEVQNRDLKEMTEDWERLAFEIADILADGNTALEEASDQVAFISDTFQQRSWIGDQVERLIKSFSEKDLVIEELQKCLEEAQTVRCDMEWKLRSLRGATLAITEAQLQENTEKESEIIRLTSELTEKTLAINKLEKFKRDREQAEEIEMLSRMTLNRLSELNTVNCHEVELLKLLLNESNEMISQKDALLLHQISLRADAEKEIQSLRLQLQQSQEVISGFQNLSQQQEDKEETKRIEKEQEYLTLSNIAADLQTANEIINEFRVGMSTLNSCMKNPVAQTNDIAEEQFSGNIECADYNLEDRLKIEQVQDTLKNDQGVASLAVNATLVKKTECVLDGEKSSVCPQMQKVLLVKKEVDSFVVSLQGLRDSMTHLLNQKEEYAKTEILSRANIEHLTGEVLRLESEIIDKEKLFDLKLLHMANRLQAVKEMMTQSIECLCKSKKSLKVEVAQANALATQKTLEATNLLIKFEEVQETMKDADIMVNALMQANETAKFDIERLQNNASSLTYERDILINDVKTLQLSLDRKEEEYLSLVNNFSSNIIEVESLVLGLEESYRNLQKNFTDKFESVVCDLEWLTAWIQNYTESIRIGLEETWSEIIGKDYAVSVLHLCHMGILIERITGLNVENGFLQNGLTLSNSVITDLTEHNARAERELEMCRILKGKLLVDIKSSFHRIARKEDETFEFRSKLNSFEKKISQLQSQEESMIARSNSMGNELAVLVREMEASNKNALTAALFQEELLREKEELIMELEDTSKLLNELQISNEMFLNSPSDLTMFVDNPYLKFSRKADTSRTSSIEFLKEFKEYKNHVKIQVDSIKTKLFAKVIELLVMTSELENFMNQSSHMTSMMADMERQGYTSRLIIEKIKTDMILSRIDVEIQGKEIHSLTKENEELRNYVQTLKEENVKITGELEATKAHYMSSLSRLDSFSQESNVLHDRVCSLESCVARLQFDLDSKKAELEKVLHSHEMITTELNMKNKISEIQNERTNALISETDSLKGQLKTSVAVRDEAFTQFGYGIKRGCDLVQSMDIAASKLFQGINDQLVSLMQRIDQINFENETMLSKISGVLDCMQPSIKKLVLEVTSLHSEVMRKDEMVKGLLFDLSLLQESASVAKDERDKLMHMVAMVEHLEDELSSRSSELDEVVARGDILESELLKKNNKISSLELVLKEKSDTLKLVSIENHDLKTHLKQIVEMKNAIEEETNGKTVIIERLEEELLGISALLGQRNNFVENLHKDIAKVTQERDNLSSELLILKEKLEMTQALAEENEAIATEARQIAQVKQEYAEEKEEEVKLLEKSIEELECTVYAMESKVDIVKAEAENQRLQREELEMKLQAVHNQMLSLPSSGTIMNMKGGQTDLSRHFDEKTAELGTAQTNFQVLQKEITEKDTEIVQLKAHISELNMHAEAQAVEYKQKFKELEIMAQKIKSDPASVNTLSLEYAKPDKCVVKSRGSGSPFKCIGMGLVHQVNSEKEEDLIAAKHHIEELESLAASRQKEIFMLKSRLAAAESMTHDVIRDLLGVKLDMTNYASLLDHQTPKVKEVDQVDEHMSQEKEEVMNLKKQVNEFIEERQSWLDELVAAQIAAEKIRQREQILSTENGILNAENANFKRTIVELEAAVKKLSKQQNLQQRIHHHAKIKEENIFLKTQNEELNVKLKRYEEILSRVKHELAQYRSSCNKNPHIDFDEEEELRKRLQDSEEDRIQLSQKLLELCRSILKVAGLAESTSDMNISAAEAAVCQLKDHISSLENELQDFKLKCKILHEKLRLHEIGQQNSPFKHQYPSPQRLKVR